jgi:chromosome segregation ATPase
MERRAALEAELVDTENAIAEAEAHLRELRAELPSLPQDRQVDAVELIETKTQALQLMKDYHAQLARELAGRGD